MEWLLRGYIEFLNVLKTFPLWAVFVYFFLVGAVVGSFLNVCIYRLPRKLSVVSPRSRCPACNTKIPWYYNIPILSYVMLRGRCASCGVSFSPVYPFVELLTAIYFCLLLRFYGPYPPFLVYAVFGCMTIILIFVDYYHKLLPAVITFPGIALGFLSSFINPFITPLESGLGIVIGGVIPTVVLVGYKWIRKREGLGHGDIVMLAMVGAFLGWKMVFVVILFSSLIGAAVGLLIIVLLKKDAADFLLPYGTFIGATALAAVFVGRWLWTMYFLHT